MSELTYIVETTDLPNSSSGAPLIAPGTVVDGAIGIGGDKDWFAVTLEAGQVYTFTMVGDGVDRLRDPILRLYSADGTTKVGTNDDGLAQSNSALVYTAATSGTYYISAADFGATNVGHYELTMTTGATPLLTVAMNVALVDVWNSWSATRETGADLTVSFKQTGFSTAEEALASSTNTYKYWNYTDAQKAATFKVIDMLDDLVNVHFTFVSPDSYSDEAIIRYQNYAYNDGAGGFAQYPGSTATSSTSGDVYIQNSTTAGVKTTFYPYELMIHETGHAMGLSHPENYTSTTDVEISQDSNAYTVMSYTGREAMGFSGLDEQTFMITDIAALQLKYGANYTTRSGDTIYGIGGEAGTLYDFDSNHTPCLAIWDGAGRDTINLSVFLPDQKIDLHAASFSNAAGYIGNISIAYGVTIEDAVGGKGDDLLIGNDVANVLDGDIGKDNLDGGAGNDTLIGGQGVDTLAGGAGNDMLYGDAISGGAEAQDAQLHALVTTSKTNSSSLNVGNVALEGADGSFTYEFLWQLSDTVSTSYNIRIGNLSFQHYASGAFNSGFTGVATGAQWYSDTSGTIAIYDNALHRITMSWGAVTGTYAYYLDGTLVQAETLSGDRVTPATGSINIADNASIGDLRIWDHELTAAEVRANAFTTIAAPASTAGLLGNWVGNSAGTLVSTMGGSTFTRVGNPTAATSTFWENGAGDILAGGAGDDQLQGGAGDDAIDGGVDTDTAVYSGHRAEYTLSYDGATQTVAVVDLAAGRDGADTISNVEYVEFADGTFAVGDLVPDSVCFLAGTMIRTPTGEAKVETLSIGDRVVTADGRFLPVKFIGRQTIVTRFADKQKTQPIRIRAGALADHVPARDLFTSPGHALVIDGMLVIAGALVNGQSICRVERMPERFTYFHIELDEHAVIFAEGAPTETYCDNVPREVFDNAAAYMALYPDATPIVQLDMPTVKSARQLPNAVRRQLEARMKALSSAGSRSRRAAA